MINRSVLSQGQEWFSISVEQLDSSAGNKLVPNLSQMYPARHELHRALEHSPGEGLQGSPGLPWGVHWVTVAACRGLYAEIINQPRRTWWKEICDCLLEIDNPIPLFLSFHPQYFLLLFFFFFIRTVFTQKLVQEAGMFNDDRTNHGFCKRFSLVFFWFRRNQK